MDIDLYIEFLRRFLEPYYRSGKITGGHDWLHVDDVIAMGPKIRQYLEFNEDEFTVAALLHNTDRSPTLSKIGKLLGGWEEHLRSLLHESPFGHDARERIIFAVLNHSKKELPADAPVLAVALQDADKLVRFRPSNILYGGAHGGSMGIPAFLPVNPFGFTSTREADRSSMLLGFMGNLEWIGMLSCDAARELIDPAYLALLMQFIRLFGREIAEHTGYPNAIEDDIRKGLGSYYEWVHKRIQPFLPRQ